MSFPKSKRFDALQTSCAPAPGSYDPKVTDHTPGVSLQTSERFKANKDGVCSMVKYGSDTAVDVMNGCVTPKKMLFKPPNAISSLSKVKKELKRKDELLNPSCVKDLQKELRALVTERADIDKRLANRESEVLRIESRLLQVHKDKSALTARVATLERNVASVTKSNETLKHQMTSNTNTHIKAKGLKQELSSLHSEADKHARETKSLREQLENARKDAEVAMGKSTQKFAKLQEEHKALETEKDNAEQEIKKLKTEIETLKAEKQAVEKERDAIRVELLAAQNVHKAQMETLKKDMDDQIAQLTKNETCLTEDIKALNIKNKDLEQNHGLKSAVEEECAVIRAELVAAENKNLQMTSAQSELEIKLVTVTEREAGLKTKLEEIETKTLELEENLAKKLTVEDERDAIRAELEVARNLYKQESGVMQGEMETCIATLAAQEELLNKNIEVLSNKARTLEQELADKGAVEEERDALRSELEATRIAHEAKLSTVQQDLDSQIVDLTEREATLNTNIEALTTKYHSLEENLVYMQTEHQLRQDLLQREVLGLKTSLYELQLANDSLSTVNCDLMGRLTIQQEEVDSLETKLSEAECLTNEKFELLTNYLDTKTADIDRLKAQVAEKSAEVQRLTGKLEAAQKEIEIQKGASVEEIASLTKELEQRSLEEQDLRWQLEKTLTQVVESQELVETRQEELRTLRHLREESERETNEEMEVIRVHMERAKSERHEEAFAYQQRIEQLTTISAVEQDQLRKCSEAAEVELHRQITKLEEDMAAAEKASFDEIEGLKLQLEEKEESNQRELARMHVDMAGCETAATAEVASLKDQLDEVETSANQTIRNLVGRLADIRLQNNEVITELKEQLQDGYRERSILEESHRRALETEKTEKRQRISEQTALKTDMEKLRHELDAERAANACTVRMLEEEREQNHEALEDRDSCIADLEEQLEDAENLLSENVTTLERELRKNTAQMEELHRQMEQTEQAALKSEMNAAAEVEEIRGEMATIETTAAKQINDFERQINAVQQEAQKEVADVSNLLEEVRQQYDDEVTKLSVRLQVRDEEIARLNAHLNNTQQVANSVKEKCSVLKGELNRLSDENKAERAQIVQGNETATAEMEQEYLAKYGRMRDDHWEEMTVLREQHEAELERRSTENGAHHHLDLQQMIKAHQELQEKFDALEKLVGPFQEQLSAFEADRLALIGSKTNAEHEVDKLSTEYAKLLGHHNQKQKIKHVLKLKQENNRLRHDLTSAHEELTKLKLQYTRLDDRSRQQVEKKKFDPTKAFQHAKENQTPPVSPLRPGNRI